jgi:hypothetical protein
MLLLHDIRCWMVYAVVAYTLCTCGDMCCCLYTLLLQVLKDLLSKEHKDRDDYTDQLEELECGITKPEMLTMVDELMAMRLEGTSHLGIFTTLYELRASHQTCVRHEWLREMVCTCSALHNATLCANARVHCVAARTNRAPA